MKLLLAICALSVAAYSQISGSVVVFELTAQGFYIAADSRATFERRMPEDNHCKVSAISSDGVFAATGNTSNIFQFGDIVPPWDSIKEAKRAARAVGDVPDITERINVIADEWADSMRSNWSLVKIFHPEKVREAGSKADHVLTIGIFAAAIRSMTIVVARSISFKDETVTTDRVPLNCPANVICAIGHTDIFLEFVRRSSDRAKKEVLPDLPLLKVNRLVELTIKYDESGTVGGPIDALWLTPQGQIVWQSQKADCPENHY